MSHGITEFDSMFSTGKVPWHKLGKRLPELATMEEAIEASGLGWSVVKAPISARVGKSGSNIRIPGRVATMRESDNLPLGVVRETYKVIQNEELFAFARALVDTDEAVFETAGSLFGGKLVWALMKRPESIILPGNAGEIIPYIFVSSSHDGTRPLTAGPTPVRVECANTLGMAHHGSEKRFVIRHTRLADPAQRITEAQEALGFTFKWYDEFERQAIALVSKPMSWSELEEFTTKLIPNRKGEDAEEATRAKNRREAIIALATNSPNLEPVRGTAWATYNAVAEFADHGMTFRETKIASRADNRAASILDGAAHDLKAKALALLS